MNYQRFDTKEEMGAAAAAAGAVKMRASLREMGEVNIIVATGASQFEMLEALTQEVGIEWDKVTVFHLDEYVGLSIEHPASFRKYLKERFEDRLPGPVRAFHYIDAEDAPEAECRRMGELIAEAPIDVAFVGIGENGHLAFNDPPADFDTVKPYLVVDLDEACRQQQFGEGWFPSLEAVPEKAISMSVRQIMKSGTIICTVPDERKSEAVRNAVEGEVTAKVPASILQEHEDCHLYLDGPAAILLNEGGVSQ
ncbi:MAG: glucosamine-6-phosphate deaminase [Akkermansiaceae bacterium]|jgi:glucosamine-6-phosphate deaminase|tara:strand:- start:3513 stop:4268 length:756 start_codon:yes stop_codon:yes gene_type:complete